MALWAKSQYSHTQDSSEDSVEMELPHSFLNESEPKPNPNPKLKIKS